jgi:hypothetical protein
MVPTLAIEIAIINRPGVTIGAYMKKSDVKLLKKDIEKLKYAGLDLSDLMR